MNQKRYKQISDSNCKYYSIDEYKEAQGLICTQYNCGDLKDWKFDDTKLLF